MAWTEHEAAVTRAKIVEMRRDDVSFEEIGKRLWATGEWPGNLVDPPAKQAVFAQWKRGIRDAGPAGPLELLRAERRETLTELQRRAQEILDTDHYAVAHGRIVLDADGRPVIDDAPKLAAIARIAAIQKQLSQLQGEDAPVEQRVKLDADVEYTVVGVDPEALK